MTMSPRAEIATVALHTPTPAPATARTVHVPILIYHNTEPDYPHETKDGYAFNMPPDVLDAQLTYLDTHGFTVVPYSTLVDVLLHPDTASALPPKPVVLTFDDGWVSQYRYAVPLLEKHHMTATFFMYTNAIGRLRGNMTWDHVKELTKKGMTIGDHTQSHPHVQQVTDAQLEQEIVGAKTVLDTVLGQDTKLFATPYGRTSPALVEILRKHGFVVGRTTYPGSIHTTGEMLAQHAYLITTRDMKRFGQIVGE